MKIQSSHNGYFVKTVFSEFANKHYILAKYKNINFYLRKEKFINVYGKIQTGNTLITVWLYC